MQRPGVAVKNLQVTNGYVSAAGETEDASAEFGHFRVALVCAAAEVALANATKCTWADKFDALGLFGDEERGIATEVILRSTTAPQGGSVGQFQPNVASQADCAAQVVSLRHADRSATRTNAGIHRRLNGCRVECCMVALGAEVLHVEYAARSLSRGQQQYDDE